MRVRDSEASWVGGVGDVQHHVLAAWPGSPRQRRALRRAGLGGFGLEWGRRGVLGVCWGWGPGSGEIGSRWAGAGWGPGCGSPAVQVVVGHGGGAHARRSRQTPPPHPLLSSPQMLRPVTPPHPPPVRTAPSGDAGGRRGAGAGAGAGGRTG